MRLFFTALLSVLAAGSFGPAGAFDNYVPPEKIPAELKALIAPGTRLLAFEAADLNDDGRPDYLFVLEKQKGRKEDPEIEQGQRLLEIALRRDDGSLTVVKTNDKIVYCSTCGGKYGDAFAGISAGTGTFSVGNYGGAVRRWANDFQFRYAPGERTWLLVAASESIYHIAHPDKLVTESFEPPKDFGKIDIADFDPKQFKGVGRR